MNQIKTDLSIFNNQWYRVGASKPKQLLWFIVNAVVFQNSLFFMMAPKRWLLKAFGCQLGKGLVIKPSVNIKYPWKLSIGDHVWIGEKVWIDNLAPVVIESNCCISQGAMLLCGNHNYKKQAFDLMVGEIVLEEGSWVGAQALVGPNVRVGSHAVLAVSSVATGNLKPYTIYRGNPAQAVAARKISE